MSATRPHRNSHRLARLMLSLALLVTALVPLGVTAQSESIDGPNFSAASRWDGPYY